MTRPKCRYCGKPLTEQTESRERVLGADEIVLIRTEKDRLWQAYQEACNGGTKQLVEKALRARARAPAIFHRPDGEHVTWENVPTGNYGYNGNGRFCTLRCGYRWALQRAQ